jgi:hypothetical protein
MYTHETTFTTNFYSGVVPVITQSAEDESFHQGRTILQLKEMEGKVRQAPVSNLMKFISQNYKPFSDKNTVTCMMHRYGFHFQIACLTNFTFSSSPIHSVLLMNF